MARRRLLALTVAGSCAAGYLAGVATGLGVHAPARGSILDQAESKIEANAAHPVARTTLQQAAIEGMLSALDDRWAAYYSPSGFQQFADVLGGRYSGVGVWLDRAPDGQVVVESVQAGSPAARAGLHVGDVVLGVAGASVVGRPVSEIVTVLRGRPGTYVPLLVAQDGRALHLRLQRVELAQDDVSRRMLSSSVVELRIAAFTAGVARWVYQQVQFARERHLGGIVLDLRNNPGGLLDEAVGTASAFLSAGPVVTYVQRGDRPRVIDAWGGGDDVTPLVVLVNGQTASAAEIVAGALHDRGRGLLVGSRTFGKGTVQAPLRLADGSAIELTVGRYLTPAGKDIEGVGIEPDVLIPPGAPAEAAEVEALLVLSGMLADTGSSGRG
jgi:carboxyl-terminal processing protease